MRGFATFLLLAALVTATGAPPRAATPSDTFVMAKQIDDVITLDPAEAFEFSGAEVVANVYDRLLRYDLDDVRRLVGDVAVSWRVSADGRSYRFRIRPGMRFHSGNPVTAHDAAWSLQRVIRLDLAPAFLLGQFGFTPENVEARIRAEDEETLVIETEEAFAPEFLLTCLTAGVASVVDRRAATAQALGGDMGHGWLTTHSAGSGPFRLLAWRPHELILLERHERHWRGTPAMRRVVIRHIPESATQRLLLEGGDIDVARDLTPDQIQSLARHPDIAVERATKGKIYYLGLNQKNPHLRRPGVRKAVKYLVDYAGIRDTIMAGRAIVHQSFLPRGFLGAIGDAPYALDVERARALLAGEGLQGGFGVTMDARKFPPIIDIAPVLQASFAKAGIELEIIPGDGKQTLTKYRARNHDIYIGEWGPDYRDPHSNAEAFASNPDNSANSRTKSLAWRNGWVIPEFTALVAKAARERDRARRIALYETLQRRFLEDSPFVILFQEIELAARRREVSGFRLGPSFDTNFYGPVAKG